MSRKQSSARGSKNAELIRSEQWCFKHFTGFGTSYKIFQGLAVLWLDKSIYENVMDPSVLRKIVIDNCGSPARKKALLALRNARNCTEHKGLTSSVINNALEAVRFLKNELQQVEGAASILEQIDIMLA